jgi:nitric oxide reductase large subunit
VSWLPVIVLVISVMAVPVGSVIGMAFWTRRLGRQGAAPRSAVRAAQGLAAAAGLAVAIDLVGILATAVRLQSAAPSDRARTLGEGISEAMNLGALWLLVAVVGMLWLGFCTWRWRTPR